MAISPLQAYSPTTVFPELCVGKKNCTSTSAFDTILSSLGRAGGGSPVKVQQAAAELLRIEMMQNSLSLSDAGEASPPSGLKALESLLAGLPGTHQAALSGKSHANQTTDEESALLGEISGSVSPGTKTEIDAIGKTAAHFIGTPYRFGGEGPTGIDCSSFVQQVFRENQISLPRTAREQSKMGSEVADGDLQKGDLVFFHTYASYPSHVGIYLGDGKMIHASSGKGEVTVSDINSDYYRSHFLGAKRIA
jgi:cell wall-associated NlpC family hydrolase